MRNALRTARQSRGVRLLIASLFSLALVVPAAPVGAASGTGISSSAEDDLQAFALSLVNCTRTGGWVRSNGTCDRHPSKKYRSVKRKPLTLSEVISEKVAENLAVKCAKKGSCSHSMAGGYKARFRKIGVRSYTGEALGYGWWGNARKTIISSYRTMQQEKIKPGAWGRWHYRYIKEPKFKKVGIGIAKRGSYSVVVYDFAS
ncbi:MAG: hypothetical protein U0667_18620 [Chloroflexota bacterium]|jgi:hypothetical protein